MEPWPSVCARTALADVAQAWQTVSVVVYANSCLGSVVSLHGRPQSGH